MNKTAYRIKREAWGRAERAVEYLRVNPHATYPQAAKIYNVRVHQIRARINHRFGSLGEMRLGLEPLVRRLVRGRCVDCNQMRGIREGGNKCRRCEEGRV